MKLLRVSVFVLLAAGFVASVVPRGRAQQRPAPNQELIATRNAIEKELAEIAIIDRKVMVPMRDGKRMATDVYRPKDTSKKYPIIFVRTPYNFNFWDVRNGAPRDMSAELEAVKRGYAYVEMNERGHFFSEGNYDILGAPLTDGDDAITWMSSQPWSNGKVGTIGCSSTAEWQLGVAAQGNPAFAAMIPQGFGAGVGRVAPYLRAGQLVSRRRGADAVHRLALRRAEPGAADVPAQHVAGGSDPGVEDVRPGAADAAGGLVEGADASARDGHHEERWTGRTGIFADRAEVSTGGAMIKRAPNDPAWYRGGLWHDDMKINVPGFWFMSWYDVSVGPNLAAYNFVRKTARPEIGDAAVRGDRADAALLLQAGHGTHDRRRARHGRCAAGLRRADLRLVRPFPEGRRQPDPAKDCPGSAISRWE